MAKSKTGAVEVFVAGFIFAALVIYGQGLFSWFGIEAFEWKRNGYRIFAIGGMIFATVVVWKLFNWLIGKVFGRRFVLVSANPQFVAMMKRTSDGKFTNAGGEGGLGSNSRLGHPTRSRDHPLKFTRLPYHKPSGWLLYNRTYKIHVPGGMCVLVQGENKTPQISAIVMFTLGLANVVLLVFALVRRFFDSGEYRAVEAGSRSPKVLVTGMWFNKIVPTVWLPQSVNFRGQVYADGLKRCLSCCPLSDVMKPSKLYFLISSPQSNGEKLRFKMTNLALYFQGLHVATISASLYYQLDVKVIAELMNSSSFMYDVGENQNKGFEREGEDQREEEDHDDLGTITRVVRSLRTREKTYVVERAASYVFYAALHSLSEVCRRTDLPSIIATSGEQASSNNYGSASIGARRSSAMFLERSGAGLADPPEETIKTMDALKSAWQSKFAEMIEYSNLKVIKCDTVQVDTIFIKKTSTRVAQLACDTPRYPSVVPARDKNSERP